MRTIEKTVYFFSELNDKQKEAAINNLRDINVYHGWWEWTVIDAKDVGLDIESFDLYRGEISGSFVDCAHEAARLVVSNHGEGCDTYKTAAAYLSSYGELVKKYSNGVNIELVDYDNEDEFDAELEELDKEFIHDLLEDYICILRREDEYLQSEEAIIETIEANGYEFNEDGTLI